MPIAVLLAGVLIAGSVLYTKDGNVHAPTDFGNNNSGVAENVRAVSEDDHILGDVHAPVSIIEYSDFECPFCTRLHPTLARIVEDFPNDVKWVYRHFPLTSIHAEAEPAALAAECVADLGGNDAFWSFADEVFAAGPLGNNVYVSIANKLGIKESDFSRCLSSRKFEARVTADAQNAVDSGGRGTPYVIVINEAGKVFPFSGELPYANVRAIVQVAINENE